MKNKIKEIDKVICDNHKNIDGVDSDDINIKIDDISLVVFCNILP